MARKIGILLGVMIAMLTFLCTSQAQVGQEGWKKTITLPNGDVILDMNGEWDTSVYDIRPGSVDITTWVTTKITQRGSSFVGISMTALPTFRKGSEQIKGELDKRGFKQVQIISSAEGNADAKGQINEDGNHIIIEEGEEFRLIFNRK